jgi:hypothetical protein
VFEPSDLLQLVGRDPIFGGGPGVQHYVVTGDSGQLPTLGPLAAMLLCDAVLGRPSPWAATFSPSRVVPSLTNVRGILSVGGRAQRRGGCWQGLACSRFSCSLCSLLCALPCACADRLQKAGC